MNIYRARQYREEQGEHGDGGSGGEQAQGVSQEILDEAVAEGWRPEEEYSGKAPWVDAETFVKRGREINPILKKNNERLLKELKALKDELDGTKMSVQKMQEYNANIEAKAYERAIADLKAQRKTAMKQGDLETAVEIEEEMENLEANKPEPEVKTVPEGPKADPVLQSWVEENKTWYNDENTEMLDYANAAGIRLRRNDPENKLVGRPFLDEILKIVKKQFPEKFGAKRGAPSTVEGGSGSGARSGTETKLADLPPEARAAYRDLAKEEWYVDMAKKQKLTPEQLYIRDYNL